MTRPVEQNFTPTTGSTIQMLNSDDSLSVNVSPVAGGVSAPIATLTIAWPTRPHMGQVATLLFQNTVGTISHTGATLDKTIANAVTGDEMEYIYNATNTTWYQLQATNNLNMIPRLWLAGTRKSLVKDFDTSATVASGNAVFYLTDNGLSTGNAIFTNPYTQSINLITFDSANQYQYGTPVFSSGNKILTIPVTRLGLSLGIITFTSAANGTVVYLQVKGD